MVVDHKSLLPLYNSSGRLKQARVDCHRMKLEAYRFKMKWEPEDKNPFDNRSRQPPEGRETCGEDDTNIYMNCMLEDQLELSPVRRSPGRCCGGRLKDPVMQQLVEGSELLLKV